MRCRDCKYMHLPEGQRVYKDRMYRCNVVVPYIDNLLPYSVTSNYWYKSVDDKMKACIDPVKEHNCPTFEKV